MTSIHFDFKNELVALKTEYAPRIMTVIVVDISEDKEDRSKVWGRYSKGYKRITFRKMVPIKTNGFNLDEAEWIIKHNFDKWQQV